ncbi:MULTISPECIES: 2-phospho-L-lactate guanylyltransferase [Marinomonas]|uniref:2-phospho-L-lactate guanylyltransferase n=1 Tax=Marinomonas TaxID=28253 RepID=UPI001056A37B|nr:2-phospho-L-lactate guanylyltransferase [Marinomonas flavescens]
MSKLCIVIPMKCPKRAKQRLATCLPQVERESLAISMFQNTLAFFRTHFPDLQVMVISESSEMLALASSYSAQTVLEKGSKGLNGALLQACEWVNKAGFSHQMIVPSDIALLDKCEFSVLLKAAKRHQVVVAKAKDGGTNALVTSPPNAIDFHYGQNSAEKHGMDALDHDLSFCQLELPNLSQDIDQSDDLERAIAQQPERFLAWRHLSNTDLMKERQYA